MTHRYLWNPQTVDQLFADEQVHYDGGQSDFVTDGLLWALTDQLNSVRDLATYDSGQDETTVALHRVFDAYGNKTSSTGSADSVFGYTGKLYDAATGLQNNLNRWYDAAVGRGTSEDPIAADANLYRYCGNSPTNSVDPSGLAGSIYDEIMASVTPSAASTTLGLKQANAGGVRHGCFIEISDDTISGRR